MASGSKTVESAEPDVEIIRGSNGRPMAQVGASMHELINIGNYSNVTVGPIKNTRYVDDHDDLDELLAEIGEMKALEWKNQSVEGGCDDDESARLEVLTESIFERIKTSRVLAAHALTNMEVKYVLSEEREQVLDSISASRKRADS